MMLSMISSSESNSNKTNLQLQQRLTTISDAQSSLSDAKLAATRLSILTHKLRARELELLEQVPPLEIGFKTLWENTMGLRLLLDCTADGMEKAGFAEGILRICEVAIFEPTYQQDAKAIYDTIDAGYRGSTPPERVREWIGSAGKAIGEAEPLRGNLKKRSEVKRMDSTFDDLLKWGPDRR
ncbi:hypothetical protein DRE_01549 [Drechslerella stenobrocha 248]|uniref:Uncharacterized protein n=1 Tax=Drechslerella stenobrocha 248 TaxID=1043628 RepID=W7HUB3_9PEZI|nr:hypothetical protein DRE_01549 [Drechslerella stenobrocha 248]